MVPISTKRPLVKEPGTNGNHAPFGQRKNESYISNRQEIPVLEGTE